MKIHNLLDRTHRTRAFEALEAVVAYLPKCRPSANDPDDGLIFALESPKTDVECLRLQLRKTELRVFVAVTRGGRLQRTSFVEHLCEGHPTSPRTMARAMSRLCEWRRYVDDVPTDDVVTEMEQKQSTAVQVAVGAVSIRDDRWKALWIHPAFDTRPPRIIVGEQSGRTSAVRVSGAKEASCGTMSDELVHALSSMSDRMFVSSSKHISNPGIQFEFGPLPGIRVVNDLSSIDLLNSMRHAETDGLKILP